MALLKVFNFFGLFNSTWNTCFLGTVMANVSNCGTPVLVEKCLGTATESNKIETLRFMSIA